MSNGKGWIGVDLDGTLAEYDQWRGLDHIGEPIPKMVEHVKGLIAKGHTIKIFTARVSNVAMNGDDMEDVCLPIRKWCFLQFGQTFEVTNVKDMHMIDLIDDRCTQVESGSGVRLIDLFEQKCDLLRLVKNSVREWHVEEKHESIFVIPKEVLDMVFEEVKEVNAAKDAGHCPHQEHGTWKCKKRKCHCRRMNMGSPGDSIAY